MKIGILGGTFNPPHRGHVKLGLDAAKKFGLDRVLVIPAKSPTHKEAKSLASGEDRLEMCSRIFTDGIFEISDIEIKSERESYTVYTLEMLRKIYPGDDLFLIIGSDMFLIFDRWYRYKKILKECTVCVEARDEGDSVEELKNYSKEHLGIDPDKSDRVRILNVEPFPVSSTEIREKIKNRRGVKRLVGNGVYEYIKSRGLYLD